MFFETEMNFINFSSIEYLIYIINEIIFQMGWNSFWSKVWKSSFIWISCDARKNFTKVNILYFVYKCFKVFIETPKYYATRRSYLGLRINLTGNRIRWQRTQLTVLWWQPSKNWAKHTTLMSGKRKILKTILSDVWVKVQLH